MNQDIEHLRLLSVFHYVVGGLTAVIGCFPIIHLAVGVAAVTGAFDDGNPPPPAFGWIFIAAAMFMITCAWALAIAIIVAGRKLASHTAYTYCLVVAGIECILTPFGTVLGVFTIIVLVRPSVKELFAMPGDGRRAVQKPGKA